MAPICLPRTGDDMATHMESCPHATPGGGRFNASACAANITAAHATAAVNVVAIAPPPSAALDRRATAARPAAVATPAHTAAVASAALASTTSTALPRSATTALSSASR